MHYVFFILSWSPGIDLAGTGLYKFLIFLPTCRISQHNNMPAVGLQFSLQSVSPDPESSLFPIFLVAFQNFCVHFFVDHCFHLPPTSLKKWFNFVVYFVNYNIWHVSVSQ